MSGPGTIEGYAALFGELSLNLAERGQPPVYERIEENALEIADDLYVDAHHFAASGFAFRADGTLRARRDRVGLWFEATLPATANGYDVHNGLAKSAAGALGVSFVMTDRRARREGNLEIVTFAKVVSLSVMRPGAAVYAGTRCWLSSEKPRDPQALALLKRRADAVAELDAAARRLGR